MIAREYLRTIWFQEPKEITEDALCSAMESYAEFKVKEEIEYREFLGRCYGDKNKLVKQMQDLIIKYSEGTVTESTLERIKKYQRIKKRAENEK